jgi:hypothetical protein
MLIGGAPGVESPVLAAPLAAQPATNTAIRQMVICFGIFIVVRLYLGFMQVR